MDLFNVSLPNGSLINSKNFFTSQLRLNRV